MQCRRLSKRKKYIGWYHKNYNVPHDIAKPAIQEFNAFKNVTKWVADTGSGHDLIGQPVIADKKKIRKSALPIVFSTANGDTYTDRVCEDVLTILQEPIRPYVLGNSPPVLSVGRRCRLGWAFHWPAYGDPFFITQTGTVINLTLEQDIPFLEEQSLRCQPVQPNAMFVVLGSKGTKKKAASLPA